MVANYLKMMLKRHTRQIRGQLEHITSLDNTIIIMSVGSKASLLSNNYIYIHDLYSYIYVY